MADLDALEKSHHLPSGENMPWRDEEEIIPYDIYTACSLGEHNFVRELLSEGMKKAEMNRHNCGGWTALMYAAYVGHDNVVNLLLDVDVDVNIKALKSGSTPLMLAASCGNESVVYFLLQSGADIDAQDNQGWTALYYATHQGHLNVVKLLIENGANRELKEVKHCLTPLLDAAKEGHEMIFKVILESGANATARTSQGETLRQLALRHGNISIVNVLDRQICKRVPDVMLRSEPSLFGIDMGGDDFPSQKGHYEWLGYHDNGIPHAGVQHGPEVFAKLLNQSKDAGYQPSCSLPELTPTCTVQVSTPQPIPGGSPRLTPDTQTPVGSIGSPEDCNYFFNTGCSTMRNLHLHNRLKRPSVEGRSPRAASPVSQGLVRRRESESSTPELPSLASFLEGLKLEKYIPVFEQQNFDFEDFLSLNDVELKEIGIKLLGPRKKMISAINRWKSENRTLDQCSEKELATQLQQARNQLQAYHVKLTQERELMQEFLQNEKAVREQLYDMAKGAQFELLKAASSMATLRSLTGNILDRLSSDDTLKETGAKLGSVVENTTENISQALRRVERILKGNVTALQQSPDSSELSGFSLNGY